MTHAGAGTAADRVRARVAQKDARDRAEVVRRARRLADAADYVLGASPWGCAECGADYANKKALRVAINELRAVIEEAL